MRTLVIVGILLIVIGSFGLVASGITYKSDEKKADVGPIQVRVEKEKRFPINPTVGGIVLGAGVVVLIAGIAIGGKHGAHV